MLEILVKLKQAYNLGYERQIIELDMFCKETSLRKGSYNDVKYISLLKDRINELDELYIGLGVLEKLAFDLACGSEF
mgnify:CR=1 FL=1